jgi:hypothetical protein
MLRFIKNMGKNKVLEAAIAKLQMNMSNNYKDVAQEDYKALVKLYEELLNKGGLSDKQRGYYKNVIDEYSVKMKDYTHKDQKPYWE